MKQVFLRGPSEDMGGIERQVCVLADECHRAGFLKPLLVTSDAASLFSRKFSAMGFPVFQIPMEQRSIFRAARRLEKIVNENGVIIIQSHGFRESIIARIVRLRHPGIIHIYRVHTYIDCSWIPFWKKVAYHIFDKITSHYVDRYICISRDVHDELIRRSLIPSKKVEIITNMVPASGEPDERVNTASPLPLNIAMVANIVPHKGHDVLITALRLLKERGVYPHVRLVGGELTNSGRGNDTPATDAIKRKALELGVADMLEFYGFTSDVPQALRAYPVVVLPSDSEGIPNSIIEAMGLRKIVVASRVGGIPEIIEQGKNGFLHPSRDPQALSDILFEIFSKPAREWENIRDAAYITWAARYSPEGRTDAWVRVLKALSVMKSAKEKKHAEGI